MTAMLQSLWHNLVPRMQVIPDASVFAEPVAEPSGFSILWMLFMFAILWFGANILFGMWGKSRAEQYDVNPWVGFAAGFLLGYIGVRMVPILRMDRLFHTSRPRPPHPHFPPGVAPMPGYPPHGVPPYPPAGALPPPYPAGPVPPVPYPPPGVLPPHPVAGPLPPMPYPPPGALPPPYPPAMPGPTLPAAAAPYVAPLPMATNAPPSGPGPVLGAWRPPPARSAFTEQGDYVAEPPQAKLQEPGDFIVEPPPESPSGRTEHIFEYTGDPPTPLPGTQQVPSSATMYPEPIGPVAHPMAPAAPPPTRPTARLLPDSAGYIACPFCGARTKANRRTCMTCGSNLPQ